MAVLSSEQLTWITTRLAVARMGACRLGEAAPTGDMKPNVAPVAGEIIWDRPQAEDGNPDDTAVAYTTIRD